MGVVPGLDILLLSYEASIQELICVSRADSRPLPGPKEEWYLRSRKQSELLYDSRKKYGTSQTQNRLRWLEKYLKI